MKKGKQLKQCNIFFFNNFEVIAVDLRANLIAFNDARHC